LLIDGDETGASCALDAGNQAMSTSSLASAGASLPTQPAAGSCKTPPSTPMNADSDEEETSDTTQIKYPVLDLTDMTVYPAFPPNLQVSWNQNSLTWLLFLYFFAFMKDQRIQNHLSRRAHLQTSQIQNIFTNFSNNQNIPQKYKISSDAQKSSGQSQNEKKCAQP